MLFERLLFWTGLTRGELKYLITSLSCMLDRVDRSLDVQQFQYL